MRIFPEGVGEWAEPGGKAFVILGAFALVIGGAAFLWRLQQWHHWPRTEGTVVISQVTRNSDEQGSVSCGSFIRVRYFVRGKIRELDNASSDSSGDCAAWERRAAELKGQAREVIYDPANPYNGYLVEDRFPFFVAGLASAFLGMAFIIAGSLTWVIGRHMRLRRIELP